MGHSQSASKPAQSGKKAAGGYLGQTQRCDASISLVEKNAGNTGKVTSLVCIYVLMTLFLTADVKTRLRRTDDKESLRQL